MTSTNVKEFETLPGDWAAISYALNEQRLSWQGISLAALGTVAARFEVGCEPFVKSADGHWETSRWVGSFGYGGGTWCIAPRIGWPRFTAMLSEVLSVAVSPGGRWSRANQGDLTSLAWMLAFAAAWRRHRGAAKAFVRRQADHEPTLRGRLDLAAQLAKRVDRHEFACRFDELTYDNPINRGALLAIKVMQRHQRFPFKDLSAHRRVVREWQEALHANGVETPAHFPAEPVRWSRANDGFRAAHLLAELLVGERQVGASAGQGPGAFLFDTAEVWELYLHRMLREALLQLGEATSDHSVDWPRGRRTPPDALLEWEGQPVATSIPDLRILRRDDSKETVALVIDAKYRRYRSPKEDLEIALQMFRYAAKAQREEGGHWPPAVLLYPSSPELNAQGGDGPFRLGRGRFIVAGRPPLRAWAIKLPEVGEDFHARVRDQLTTILREELRS